MDALFQNVLTASFHGGIVIAAVLLLRLILRRAPKKYVCMLWLLAGLRLLLPFQLESGLSIQPEEPLGLSQMAWAGPFYAPAMPELMAPEVAEGPETPAQAETVTHGTNAVPAEEVPAGDQPEAAEFVINWAAAVPYGWGLVLAAFGAYQILAYVRLKKRVREAVKIPGGWECEKIDTAFVLGFVRPKIYIPMGMSRENRRHILAHERTHLETGDHWIKLLGYVALAVHWFNPLVWAAYFLMCRDIEMACDERVVRFMELSERKEYSAALLECSAARAHYSACPTAFGEVNVKKRILGVLNYRRPSFWISLLSVIAVGFVAVCLVTSPREEPEGVPTEPGTTAERGVTAGLTESDVADICQKAIEELMAADSYFIRHEASVTQGEAKETYLSSIRRHGKNFLSNLHGHGAASIGGTLIWEGQYAHHNGAYWIWEYETQEVDGWLREYLPDAMQVSFPLGTGVVDGNTLSFQGVWTESRFPYHTYTGIYVYTFREDGSLAAFRREYSYISENGEEIRYENQLTVQDEKAEDTLGVIRSFSQEVITWEEYEELLRQQETVTEVPSNKTSYDQDYALGAGSKQWKFHQETAHVRIEARDYSPTGLTLHFSEADDLHTGFRAEEGFWLEELREGLWEVIGEYEAAEKALSVTWSASDSLSLNWETPLEEGFYRLGRYYTMTLPSGETETQVCYAKFRLYGGDQKALMAEARGILEDFLDQRQWHYRETNYMESFRGQEFDYYIVKEGWRDGDSYLEEVRYPYVADPDTLMKRLGYLYRGGVSYELTWAGDTVGSPLREWTCNTYKDPDSFTLWLMNYEWFDGQVEAVFREGDSLMVQSVYSYEEPYDAIQTVLLLDGEGKLAGLRKYYLPTRDCPEGDKVLSTELEVLPPQPEMVRELDLSVVGSFSWEEDRKRYREGAENVRTKNFVNAEPTALASAQSAIARALKDCTLPAAAGIEPGTNLSRALFDGETGMWKIEFTASWDGRIYQAVYMTEQGVTVMTVTEERE